MLTTRQNNRPHAIDIFASIQRILFAAEENATIKKDSRSKKSAANWRRVRSRYKS